MNDGQLPALAAWRRRGDTTLFDALWRAACWEAAALALWQTQPQGSAASPQVERLLRRAREAVSESRAA